MLSLTTESDVIRAAAAAVRDRRLELAWRQEDLAEKSGVPMTTLRRFERTGHIGFPGFAKLITALGIADDFVASIKSATHLPPRSAEEFAQRPIRARAPRKVAARA